jgi:hypothetical protein
MKLFGLLIRLPVRLLVRLVVLPIKLALAALGLTARTGFRIGRLPVRATGRSVRIVGLKGIFFLAVGLAIGLLLAPETGKQLRARLAALLGQASASDDDLAEKITFELAHAPRTWHLEQPAVKVAGGRVTLSGIVPAAEARDELGRVAAAIPGVVAVDNQIVLDLVAEVSTNN